ncbi:MAG: L-threonylcarbamoyladenylate synthase [Alphaproteobacteria bacterium]
MTTRLTTRTVDATPAAIGEAADILRAGRLVAFPTETVYGLGADARNPDAVARIFAAKGRPSINPLITHVADIPHAQKLGRFCTYAEELAAAFWPGPMTLVLHRQDDAELADAVTAGLPTVAIRIPAHPVAQALLTASGLAIAAPSANPSGRLSPTAPGHVAQELDGKVELVLAAGRADAGLESTVIDLTGPAPRLLRPGTISAEEVEAVLEGPVERISTSDAKLAEAPPSPGLLLRHYAPRLPLRLNARSVEPGEALLAFGPNPFIAKGAAEVANLSPKGDLAEAASNLFAMLHHLDRPQDFTAIAVAPIPDHGIGLALNDRLQRAAQSS